jgi:hypothetical protein
MLGIGLLVLRMARWTDAPRRWASREAEEPTAPVAPKTMTLGLGEDIVAVSLVCWNDRREIGSYRRGRGELVFVL